MELKTYLAAMSTDAREDFSKRCGTTRGHLQNVAYGYRPCSPAIASAIEKATAGEVTRKELRPDDWSAIWPELAKRKAKDAA